ncbi:tRNA (adenosine(37)-N6)-threonylcarbamoyltransferase complex dimerization subunit type 1 TsaB [Tsukamurella sp. 8F]|uniref:tRNA (adenosine(37)-N6)-threonylcarbamoyltransferase complex dimerization subunit type 1 TsaB n=1 Tax=unclassified Tsukamurella TaxID=2633480 RepID=UPI0023BA3174|nr:MULTISPECIES: tRNA (adenosine(37)-N6)-threonylcarbamoyltransferase complex dimerization subunit type 1 TsaB [unclassified Tsukamurella]MDF0531776.1 tRNA (adenosine(37)-N6)-threonylcarbamoyltransferase complex dimerization subunit type 1 TsaB [Tsukamurella sp. 8J]MDF0588022.1 tRNA (adenosine(37)-N6)-threonylcarbamoyltransferase complex dimerization subunit type 1 TsaB [Tsukamurella sp. 8F]
MFVLALDTATPSLTVGIVDLDTRSVLARRDQTNSRGHAEVLTPFVLECLDEAGLARSDIGAIVVGCGPGPFTGLRVGMATAAAFGDALGIPVHGVCSLDAIAVGSRGDTLVVTDARRREVYWARYSDGVRTGGPDVCKPADLGIDGPAVEEGAIVDGARVIAGAAPTPATLVAAAAPLIGTEPEPLVPLYLRRPDAVETAARG